MDALPTIYPLNPESWEGFSMTHAPRFIMMTGGFLLGKLGWCSRHFRLCFLTGSRSCSWCFRVFQQRKPLILWNNNSSRFSFFSLLILVAIFTPVSKRVDTSITHFYFKAFFWRFNHLCCKILLLIIFKFVFYTFNNITYI